MTSSVSLAKTIICLLLLLLSLSTYASSIRVTLSNNNELIVQSVDEEDNSNRQNQDSWVNPRSALGINSQEPTPNTVKDTGPVKVCAVPQLYQFLTALQLNSKVPYILRFGNSTEIMNLITADPSICDVVLSADEKLPISLVRANYGVGSAILPFARAPLVLWSANPKMFKNPQEKPISLFQYKAIASVAFPRSELTPVGYASQLAFNLLMQDANLHPNAYQILRSDHEYAVYAQVQAFRVHAGFITKPLIASLNHELYGSYWQVPRSMSPDIQYYVLLMNSAKYKTLASDFIRYLRHDNSLNSLLEKTGFERLENY